MASAKLTCPECKTVLRPSKPVAPGKKIKCPKCAGIAPIPIDSMLVLDRSGSMSESAGARTKIDALGTAASLFANLLRPDAGAGTGDKIGIVKYNDTNQVYAALAFADDPATAGSHIADIDTKTARKRRGKRTTRRRLDGGADECGSADAHRCQSRLHGESRRDACRHG